MRVETITTLLERRLVEAGQDPDGSVSIAELHKVLLPYSECRAALGFVTKAEYDLALLHLLGDAEQVEIDGELARAVESELSAPEPGLAFLKNYAAAQLRVRRSATGGPRVTEPEPWAAPEVTGLEERPAAAPRQEAVAKDAQAAPPSDPPLHEEPEPAPPRAAPPSDALPEESLPEESLPEESLPEESLPEESLPEESLPEEEPARPRGEASALSFQLEANEASAGCWSCAESLPSLSDLRYCPHCGADQSLRRCRDCESELEITWSFCPRCGTAAEENPPDDGTEPGMHLR